MHKKLRRLNRQFTVSRHRRVRRLKLISRHPFLIPIVAFLILAALSGAGLWRLTSRGESLTPARTDFVIISYDHHVETVPSHEPTVGALLAKLHITINAGDVVEPTVNTPINQDDFRVNVYRAVPVKILDGSNVTYAYSAAATPRSVAAQAGVAVYPEDQLVSSPVTNFLQQKAVGSVVTINRSTPVVLSLNGLASATRTRATTVGAFLAEKHIALGKDVTVQPAPSTPITPNETIAVIRDGSGIQNSIQTIAMPVQDISDPSLAYGTSAVRQAGTPGQEVLTYKVIVQHGQVVSRTLLQTVVTQQPVTQIEVVGTSLSGIKGDMALAGIAPSDYQYADYIISRESGWCPTKWQGEPGSCPAYHGTPGPGIGYGLGQATPGSKMAAYGADWATNPITQLKWANAYAVGTYGSWHAAYVHKVDTGWW